MKLARVNTALLLAIIVINVFVICLPLLPAVGFWVQKRNPAAVERLRDKVEAPVTANNTPSGNRLIIPSALFDQPVYEGKDTRTLNKGAWHRPETGTPESAGNTVITGHRYTYTNPAGTFYHLDKIKRGDEIGLWWNGKKYRYTVVRISVVPPEATEIEKPTKTPQLTLYTCTPLWLPRDRLVVVAELKEDQAL